MKSKHNPVGDNLVMFAEVAAFFLLTVIGAYAQQKAISTNQSSQREVVEERLVQLAWDKNPANKAVVYRSEIAENTLKQSKMLWLDKVRITGNLNEFTVQPDKFTRSQFFPRYNFSVSLSLGEFFTTPYEIRKSRGEYEITKLDINSQKLYIRSEVLKRYNHYVSVKDQLSIHKKLESETELNLKLVRSKFDRAEESYQTYSEMIERYYNLQMRTKELEELLEASVIDLEAMIDGKLETILGQ